MRKACVNSFAAGEMITQRPQRKPIPMDPIEEGINAAGTAIGSLPRPMLGVAGISWFLK